MVLTSGRGRRWRAMKVRNASSSADRVGRVGWATRSLGVRFVEAQQVAQARVV
jgi:hypothetical protein